jgi:hypothetical protein
MLLSMKLNGELMRRRNAGLPYSPQDVVTVRVPYQTPRVRAAMLGAAYLDAFLRLGYPFALNSNLDCIRNEILHPSDGAVSDIACINCFGPHQSVFAASAPQELMCIGVSYFNLSVILPVPEDRNLEIYERLRGLRDPFPHFTKLPFTDVRPVPLRTYPNGRYTINGATFEMYRLTQPDLRTIRRIAPGVGRHLPVLSDAPDWAMRD